MASKPDNDKAFTFKILGKPRSQKNSKKIIILGGKKCPKCKRRDGRPSITDSDQVTAWRKLAVPALEAQWIDRAPLVGPLAVVVTGFLATRRKIDTDNLLAGPLDALQKAKIVTNDQQFESVVGIRRYDKENPRVEITVMPFDWLSVDIGAPDWSEQ